jgi:hypothetical protein
LLDKYVALDAGLFNLILGVNKAYLDIKSLVCSKKDGHLPLGVTGSVAIYFWLKESFCY